MGLGRRRWCVRHGRPSETIDEGRGLEEGSAGPVENVQVELGGVWQRGWAYCALLRDQIRLLRKEKSIRMQKVMDVANKRLSWSISQQPGYYHYQPNHDPTYNHPIHRPFPHLKASMQIPKPPLPYPYLLHSDISTSTSCSDAVTPFFLSALLYSTPRNSSARNKSCDTNSTYLCESRRAQRLTIPLPPLRLDRGIPAFSLSI